MHSVRLHFMRNGRDSFGPQRSGSLAHYSRPMCHINGTLGVRSRENIAHPSVSQSFYVSKRSDNSQAQLERVFTFRARDNFPRRSAGEARATTFWLYIMCVAVSCEQSEASEGQKNEYDTHTQKTHARPQWTMPKFCNRRSTGSVNLPASLCAHGCLLTQSIYIHTYTTHVSRGPHFGTLVALFVV